jgi:hypothetical protein
MKDCVECGKKLGVIDCYRHPTMGKKHPLCRKCFDLVVESVEKYTEFLSPYIGFFEKETSIHEDFQKLGKSIAKRIRNTPRESNNPLLGNTNQTYS